MTFEKKISALLEEGRRVGLYSHYAFACGFLEEEAPCFFESKPSENLFFDLASLTKAFVTSPLVLDLGFDEKTTVSSLLGASSLTKSLDKRLLELRVFDLLSHVSGLASWFNFYTICLGDIFLGPKEILVERLNLCAKKLLPPGDFKYSDAGYLLLGLCLEEISGKRLNELFRSLCKKMSLREDLDLFFPRWASYERSRCVSTSYCSLREKHLQGEVHDENAWFLGEGCGHAGLFGSCESIIEFLQKFSKSKSFDLIHQMSFSNKRYELGFAWRVNQIKSTKWLGHLGFTGCGFWVNPDKKSYLLFLSNRVKSGRLSPSFSKLRQEAFSLGSEFLG